MSNNNIYFTDNTIQFIKELSVNNNKEWFQSHQKEYEEYYKNPIRELVKEISNRFAALQIPYHSSPKLSLFRINRDIRFSKNKEPYKTNIGIFFPYSLMPLSKKSVDKPGLYCHLEPDNSFIAGGIHMPAPDDIKKIREYLSENWQNLDKIINDTTLSSEFPNILQGEMLKRMPKGYSEDHPRADWIKLKGFVAFTNVKDDIFINENFIDIIEQKAIAIAQFLDFFYNAINEQE